MMKHNIILFISLIFVVPFIVGCGGKQTNAENTDSDADSIASDTTKTEVVKPDTIVTETFSDSEKSKYAEISISAQIPTGSDGVSTAIRNDILESIDAAFAFDWEGQRNVQKYKGDRTDLNKYVSYYAKSRLKPLDADAKQTNIDMQMDDIMKTTDELRITKYKETKQLIEFSISGSTFIAGAAHPSNSFSSLIFNKETGKQFKQFLKKGAGKNMQALLIQGLISYFKDCGEDASEDNIYDYLLLSDPDNKFIPLPQSPPSPQEDGLCFTYTDTEIAPHAMGMPSFTISYNNLLPYLTDEAKTILGI